MIEAQLEGLESSDLLDSVRGLVFFGVPHKGSYIAFLGSLVARICSRLLPSFVNVNFLEALERSSKTLEEISERFANIGQNPNIIIRTFYETRPMSILQLNVLVCRQP